MEMMFVFVDVLFGVGVFVMMCVVDVMVCVDLIVCVLLWGVMRVMCECMGYVMMKLFEVNNFMFEVFD